jgi:hypothetical protein
VNTHRRYARVLAAGSALLTVSAIAVAVWSLAGLGLDGGGFVAPVVAFLYGAVFLAWCSRRERVAGRRAAERVCCALFRTSGTVHGGGCLRHAQAAAAPTDKTAGPGPAHDGLLCFGEHGDVLCVRPAGDAHTVHVPYRGRA